MNEDDELFDEQDEGYIHISYSTLMKLKYIFIIIAIVIEIFAFVLFGTYLFNFELGFNILFALLGLIIGILFNLIFVAIWFALKKDAIKTEQEEIALEITSKLNDIISLNIDELDEYTVYVSDDENELYKTITGNRKDEINDDNEEIEDFNVRLYIKENVMNFMISPNNEIEVLRQVNVDKIEIFSISFDQIKYFVREGDKQLVSNVHGNDISVGGAIIGGLLAGTAGAIIGGHREITTDILSIDERRCMLYYSKTADTKCLIIDYDAYLLLQKYIPEKNPINAIALKTDTKSLDYAEEIEKFHKLYLNGIITEQEFLSKKQELLSKNK